MANGPSGDQRSSEEFTVALDAIRDRIRKASHTDWNGVELTLAPPEVDGDDPRRRLFDLEREERTVSRRRRELHKRIDFLQEAPAPLNPSFAAQLEAYKRAERRDSTARKLLHQQIDELRLRLGHGTDVGHESGQSH